MNGTPLRVGYVHVGPREHGVTRFGHLLADAARECAELCVVEREVDLSGSQGRTWARLRKAAQELAHLDLVHLHYNNQRLRSIWGGGRAQLGNLWALATGLDAPIIVTLHDVAERPRWRGAGAFALLKLRARARRLVRRLGGRPAGTGAPANPNDRADALTLWWLHRRSRMMLVCSEDERRRVEGFLPGARVRVIPHFVERRTLDAGTADAKQALGLSGQRVLTLLGYIHPRKGHELLVRALAHLPPDVTVVFAGTADPIHRSFLEHLLAVAEESGVAQRVRVTGYLAERDLERYLAATDLGVCPFETVSASSSIATWLSAGTPILASDLPLVAEYNRMEPGAIRTFGPYTPEALAQAACEALRSAVPQDDTPGHRLRDRLSIQSILQQHVEAYRQVCGTRAGVRAASATDPRDGLARRPAEPARPVVSRYRS